MTVAVGPTAESIYDLEDTRRNILWADLSVSDCRMAFLGSFGCSTYTKNP